MGVPARNGVCRLGLGRGWQSPSWLDGPMPGLSGLGWTACDGMRAHGPKRSQAFPGVPGVPVRARPVPAFDPKRSRHVPNAPDSIPYEKK